MNDFKDLVNYVSPSRLRRIKFFFRGRGWRSNSYIGMLYQAALDGKDWDDSKASLEIFGEEGSSQYYKVKHQLRHELVNAVLLIDSSRRNQNEYEQVKLRCRKEFYAAEVLWLEGHTAAAGKLLHRLIRRAEAYELPDLMVPIIQRLRTYSVIYNKNSKEFDNWDDKLNVWRSVRQIDEEIDALYGRVVLAFNSSGGIPPPEFMQFNERINQILAKAPPILPGEVIYKICVVRFAVASGQGNYIEGMRVCQMAIEQLEAKVHPQSNLVRSVYIQMISASIRLRMMEKGRQAALKAMRLANEGDQPWFQVNQMFFYLSIRSGEYAIATSIINRVMSQSRFAKQIPNIKERFYLSRAYLSWILLFQELAEDEEKIRAFRIGRFLNDVPEFARDKHGFNVPVLVIQMLWLLYRKQYGEVTRRLTRLRRYASRHLARNNGTMRNFYFLQMLVQLKNARFNRKNFIRKAAPHLEAMSNLSSREDTQSLELEILPYEVIYEHLLKLLDNYNH